MERRAFLAPHIHMVRLRDDLVVLDVAADRYSCLVEGAALVTLDGPDAVLAAEPVLDQLLAAGLVTNEQTAGPRRAPVVPTAELPLPHRTSLPLRFGAAIRTLEATAAFRGRSLLQLTVSQSPVAPTPRDSSRTAARVSAYRSILPLIPFEGVCLQRAWQLRRLLRAEGLAADWVFGVKTWPFFAHCWLQVGDRVVGDRLDRVRSYAPVAVF